ncbi:MerR family transcriptional regulator [Nocardioides convexus]|uniref:MerR family transcriptional regulator n=1 Tax=Nocardioides convexus TaxID=2712224 RepID=UPI00241879AA|nr:MerR family transcriptional regulator [Nocardioides convexus]
MKSSRRDVRWSIGDLAERFDLETHVLRHWEDKGLLCPERDSAGRRVYGEDDAYRVATILASKASGMSLEQIRTLVDASTEGRRDALKEHLAESGPTAGGPRALAAPDRARPGVPGARHHHLPRLPGARGRHRRRDPSRSPVVGRTFSRAQVTGTEVRG